jgi:thioredoxin-related protein
MKITLWLLLLLGALYGGYLFLPHTKADGSPYSVKAAEDIGKAVSEAKASHKKVLIDVGSEGCIWCVRLHRFIEEDQELRELAAKTFVTVRADYRANAALLNGFGQVPGTPHFFVLAGDGKLLRSQDTESMESGKSYDRAKVLAFFKSWGI